MGGIVSSTDSGRLMCVACPFLGLLGRHTKREQCTATVASHLQWSSEEALVTMDNNFPAGVFICDEHLHTHDRFSRRLTNPKTSVALPINNGGVRFCYYGTVLPWAWGAAHRAGRTPPPDVLGEAVQIPDSYSFSGELPVPTRPGPPGLTFGCRTPSPSSAALLPSSPVQKLAALVLNRKNTAAPPIWNPRRRDPWYWFYVSVPWIL